MLTKELALAQIEGVDVNPDRLTRSHHAGYPKLAEQMCAVYRSGSGLSRKQLHAAIHEVMHNEQDCPPRRIDAFCKLLDERCKYETDESGQASNLRRTVYRAAAAKQPIGTSRKSAYHRMLDHPQLDGNSRDVCSMTAKTPTSLFGSNDQAVKASIASSLNLTWLELRHRMFLDLIENHTLQSFEDFADPTELLSRYNVAQTQVALFSATELNLVIESDFRAIIKYAKLARLMHRIARRPSGEGYLLRLDGPASVLQHTTRYGVAMAKFLPGLLSCKGWKLEAKIKKPKFWNLRLRLSPADGLRSTVSSEKEYDSTVEERFAKQWAESETNGWTLERETEILHEGQTVFFPDFVFKHTDGRKVLMEVVGFWTPEYLAHKREVLRRFRSERIIVAVQESLLSKKSAVSGGENGIQAASEHGSSGFVQVTYKTVIPIREVLERLEVWK